MSRPRFLSDLTPETLGEAFAPRAMDNLGDGVFALVAEATREELPALQAECRARGVRLVGAVFPALIEQDVFRTKGAWLLPLPPAFRYTMVDRNGKDASDVARAVAAFVGQPRGDPPVLFLVFDALVPNVASQLDALYLELADSVGYLGVCAGSETFQPIPCVFDTDRFVADALLCLLLPSDLRSVLIHSYVAPAVSLTATATTGNKIKAINWKPAFGVYQEQIKRHYGVDLDRENFYQNAVHFPFGISLANGQTLVRIPVGLDDTDSIFCVGEVPENSLLTMLEGPPPGGGATVEAIADALTEGQPWALFYCAGRRLHLAAAAEAEIAKLSQQTGVPSFGALSLGEIGCLEQGGYPFFHNGTIVATWRSGPGHA